VKTDKVKRGKDERQTRILSATLKTLHVKRGSKTNDNKKMIYCRFSGTKKDRIYNTNRIKQKGRMKKQLRHYATYTSFVYFILLTFFGAMIVHICVLFLIPSHAGNLLMERLQNQNEAWQFVTLATDNPIALRQDPAFRLRVCHFDLSKEPVRLTASGNVPFWSLSLYDRQANNLYSLNSRIMPTNQLDLVIGDPIQIMDYKQDNEMAEREGRILTQHNIVEGFVVLRVYVPSSDWEPLVQNFLQSARCDKINR